MSLYQVVSIVAIDRHDNVFSVSPGRKVSVPLAGSLITYDDWPVVLALRFHSPSRN